MFQCGHRESSVQDLVQGGEIFYIIVSGNDPLTFVIQRNGVIVTKRLLDYEAKPEYNYSYRIKDN